jgi:hypothetical protein
MTERSSSALDSLARPLYFLAILLVATPLMDILANTWPLRFSELTWRYGAVGMFSGFQLTPLLGIGLACWLSSALGHKTVQRTLTFVCIIGAILLLLAAVGFALDVVQLRHSVPTTPPQAMWTFEVGAVKALLKYLTGAIALAWFGLATRRALRESSASGGHAATPPLVSRAGEREQ